MKTMKEQAMYPAQTSKFENMSRNKLIFEISSRNLTTMEEGLKMTDAQLIALLDKFDSETPLDLPINVSQPVDEFTPNEAQLSAVKKEYTKLSVKIGKSKKEITAENNFLILKRLSEYILESPQMDEEKADIIIKTALPDEYNEAYNYNKKASQTRPVTVVKAKSAGKPAKKAKVSVPTSDDPVVNELLAEINSHENGESFEKLIAKIKEYGCIVIHKQSGEQATYSHTNDEKVAFFTRGDGKKAVSVLDKMSRYFTITKKV